MIKLFLEGISLSFMLATFATVYRGVLAYEPVLNWWFRFGGRFEGRWFYAPIWGCEKCFAGQLALWVYLFHHLEVRVFPALGPYPWNWALSANWEGYSLLCHLFSITGAILATILLTRLLNKKPTNGK